MRTAALPPLRVSPELRDSAEKLLADGETLSAFMLESLTLNIERRRAQDDFIARGLASGEKARRTGKYSSASSVLKKLEARLSKARSARASKAE
ncbi:MAG: prevent-host-death protein [Betaproteobacteria bacterium]|nr:prevent-host-death protein [Betaproteobacteria bacterium]